MDFRAVQVMCMAVSTLLQEIEWNSYGTPELHTPNVRTQEDCHKLDLLTDIMGTLARALDTRLNYVTTEGKIIREWIEKILELGSRYRKELLLLQQMEKDLAGRDNLPG